MSRPKPLPRQRQAARNTPSMASGSVRACRVASVPAAVSGADQRQTPVRPAGRFQPVVDRPAAVSWSDAGFGELRPHRRRWRAPREPRVSRTTAASAIGRQVRCSASRRHRRARRSAPATTSDGTTSGLSVPRGHGRQLGTRAGQCRGGHCQVTDAKTCAGNRRAIASHHAARWTQVSCRQVREAFARTRR